MLWQNEPTVVIGKNQNAYAEINIDYLKERGIHIARRITGGGAVYHDLGNVNYTFISSRKGTADIDFAYFTQPIIEALLSLGISAELSGRNDLLVDGRKFSGNAQHTIGNRVLHHGTLLFDSDLEVLSEVLRVDDEKLKSKAIKSARSRVVNLKTLINREMSATDFINTVADFVIDKYSPEIIDAPAPDKIEDFVSKQKSPEWIYPKRSFISDYTYVNKKKYGFGLVEINLKMSNDIISDIKIFGDFFGIKEISVLENILKGHSIFDIDILLENISVNDYIFGISNREFSEQIKDDHI